MKYAICVILLIIGFGVAGPPLYYTHALPLIPAIMSGLAFCFCFYLLDSTQFLTFSAELRKSATCYFKRGDPS